MHGRSVLLLLVAVVGVGVASVYDHPSYADVYPPAQLNNKLAAPFDAVLGGFSRGVSALTTSVSLVAYFNDFYQRVVSGVANVFTNFRNRYYKASIQDMLRTLRLRFSSALAEIKSTHQGGAETRYTEVLARHLVPEDETTRQLILSGTGDLLSILLSDPLTFLSCAGLALMATTLLLLASSVEPPLATTAARGGRSLDPLPAYVAQRAAYVGQVPQ